MANNNNNDNGNDIKKDDTLRSLEKPTLQYFSSDHAVSGRQPVGISACREEEAGGTESSSGSSSSCSSKPLSTIDVRRQSLSRQSLYWSDLVRRRSSAGLSSSLVSSITLTDYGGESFCNDYGLSQRSLCRWDEDDCDDGVNNNEHTVEDSEHVAVVSPSCPNNPSDHQPIRPIRRDSMSSGRISARECKVHDIASTNHYKQTLKEDPSGKMQKSDNNPVKPGRRESAATTLVEDDDDDGHEKEVSTQPLVGIRPDKSPSTPSRKQSLITN